MKKTFGNPCSRCGTERIIVRTWKEKVDSSVIINTETACPNKECQIEVDKINKKQQERSAALKRESEKRLQKRKESSKKSKKK
ncbi:MAG: hypothetical protein V1922_04265 [bacterium]